MRKRQLVQLALDEDMGPGDVTSEACISMERVGRATIDAKENLIVCGQDVARLVFEEVADRYAASVRYESAVPDGTRISRGERVSTIEGPARVLLVGERVALNLMMKLSGIATHVGRWMETGGAEGAAAMGGRQGALPSRG